MWFDHSDFIPFISAKWNSSQDILSKKLVDLTPNLIKWNRDIFGSLFSKKKWLFTRLVGIKKAQDWSRNTCLAKLNHDYTVSFMSFSSLKRSIGNKNLVFNGYKREIGTQLIFISLP